MAACPAEPAGRASWDAGGKTIKWLWLKDEQLPVAGSYDPAAHIAVAYTEGTELSFKNACALLYFTVSSDNVSAVHFYANSVNNDKVYISGNFGYNTETTEFYISGDGYAHYNYIKLTSPDGQHFVKGKTYYMTCIPTELPNGFTLDVFSDGVSGVGKVYNKTLKIERNDRIDLGDVVYTEKTRTLYLTPGPWDVDNVRFAAYVFNGKGENSWFDFAKVGDSGVYKMEFSEKWSSLVLCRMNGATVENNWDNKWNQTDDIKLSGLTAGHNHFTITGWGGGDYTTDVYTE